MEKIKVQSKKNYILKGSGITKLINISYRDFYLKRNNLAIFQKNGSYSLNRNNFNIYKYFSKIENDYKKWLNRNYKYNYLHRKGLKKQKKRIKNYIKKNILIKKVDNYIKLLKLTQNIIKKEINEKNFFYQLNIYEIPLVKIRFLDKFYL